MGGGGASGEGSSDKGSLSLSEGTPVKQAAEMAVQADDIHSILKPQLEEVKSLKSWKNIGVYYKHCMIYMFCFHLSQQAH